VISVDVFVNENGGQRRVASYPIHTKDEKMGDVLEELTGNGKAEVSASVSFADKDYGNGFEVRIGVSLTCNQDSKTVEKARQLALELAIAHLEQGKEVAEVIYEQLKSGN
jgi:hypothetical protein